MRRLLGRMGQESGFGGSKGQRPCRSARVPLGPIEAATAICGVLSQRLTPLGRVDAAYGVNALVRLTSRLTKHEDVMFQHILIPTDGSDLSRKAGERVQEEHSLDPASPQRTDWKTVFPNHLKKTSHRPLLSFPLRGRHHKR